MANTHIRRTQVTRSWLVARAAELRERVRRVQADLGAREPLPADSREAAIAVENDEVLQGIEAAAVDELRRIEGALQRVDAGTFAYCEKCGAEIEAERFAAAPYATTCVPCARKS